KFGLKIKYKHNRRYMLENARSLKAAEEAVKTFDSFMLLMSDHYFEKAIIEKALENLSRRPLLCVDKKPCYIPQVKDATKVLLNAKGYVMDIGKNITRWNAIDTGLFILDKTIFKTLHQLEKIKTNLTISECIKHLSLNIKPVFGCEVSGHLWLDIDTPQDVKFAESIISRV
ncbi:hypothetical protein H5T51_08345, partial [Candidatus Bathyarchaeota archaeon]|nr:hypothetical protein [Candidatus Bathyarchaeota archaeon]